MTEGPYLGTQAFISGTDISEMSILPTAKAARIFIMKIHVLSSAARYPVPVIARMNGHALGGVLIAIAPNIPIAASDTRFRMPDVQRGVPSTVGPALLPPLVGAG